MRRKHDERRVKKKQQKNNLKETIRSTTYAKIEKEQQKNDD